MLLGTLGASLLTGRVYLGQENEYLEQDKGFKKIINIISSFNKL